MAVHLHIPIKGDRGMGEMSISRRRKVHRKGGGWDATSILADMHSRVKLELVRSHETDHSEWWRVREQDGGAVLCVFCGPDARAAALAYAHMEINRRLRRQRLVGAGGDSAMAFVAAVAEFDY